MSRQIAMFIHVLAVMLQFAAAAGLIVPAEYQVAFATGLSAGQAALGWLQHHFNPDGTPATVAFIPK